MVTLYNTKFQLYFEVFRLLALYQPAITCSKLTIEALEQGKEYVQN